MSTSSDGGADLEPAGVDRPVTPRASAASRSCSPTARSSCRSRASTGTIGSFRSTNGGATWSKEVDGLEDQLPRRRRRPAHQPAADRRDRRHRARLRGLGGLPLRAQVRGERHRLQHVDRRRRAGARSARIPLDPVGQRSRPLHPRPRRSIRPRPERARTWLSRTTTTRTPPARRRPAISTWATPPRPMPVTHWSAPTQLAGPDVAHRHRGHLAGTDGRRLHLHVVQRRRAPPSPCSRSACTHTGNVLPGGHVGADHAASGGRADAHAPRAPRARGRLRTARASARPSRRSGRNDAV